ncbi:hypothetical protein [Thalassospira australica]|uniref:COG4648 family protein n=1 Tax=Thalassospira australica TaxID=1528106 RepID=UPI00051A5D23|nr:hypothetical protein [Thalassospira australica]
MAWSVPNRIITIVLALTGIAYPVVVYFGLSVVSPRVILVIAIAVVMLRAIMFFSAHKHGPGAIASVVALILILAGYASDILALRFYPVIVSATLALIFTLSLFSAMPLIERFARIQTPDLDDYGVAYTRILTKIWIGFFFINGLIAFWTALYASIEVWTLYNGLISYVLIAVLFFGEWPVRRILKARHQRHIDDRA